MKLKRSLLQLDFDEKIILFLHRHPFVFFKKLIVYLGLGALPFLAFFVMTTYFSQVLENKIIYPLLILLASLWFIFIWISLFQAWVNYYFDIYVITNRQIINIDQNGLFNRTLSKQPLSRIQDISTESRGFFATILKYGDVHVQSAGAKDKFCFREIKNPYEVSQNLNKLVREAIAQT
jgi:uncharacterized membrane protein YdbT with pleckstrin-like domain